MLFQHLAIFSASGFFSVWQYFQLLAFSVSGDFFLIFFVASGFLYEFILFFSSTPLCDVEWGGRYIHT
jgi:hypothetical protein